ncbi:MAG TPA: endonuclease/exonuclease/phosphatase family protein [Casimicrobiaceae bacterium]|nr:endonuclease/exonuclease/phosphatase family protein [Casimicrobiaceae bacterium]
MRFTVATYNIHKGFAGLMKRVVMQELRDRLHGLDADLVFLQEVVGVHARNADRYRNWPTKPQHEYLADANWKEMAYGKNAIHRHGHHGNALLSRYSIVAQDNEDISAHPFESRGILHCVVKLSKNLPDLHCMNVHLGLFERGRQWQVRALCERIRDTVPKDAPLVIAGDFNDWRHKANRALVDELEVVEVFQAVTGRPARTFPSVMPLFQLDRIYSRGLKVVEAHVHCAFPADKISDHAALAATFELTARRASQAAR